MIKCTILSCGWLASSSINACMRALNVSNHLNSNAQLSFGCCLLSRSTLLIPSTKHLKCSLDHHFHFSLPSTMLGLPTKGGKSLYQGEVTSLQRTILDTQLKQLCLIDPNDGINLMYNLESFFKSFSFYLFKSFSFYQKIFNMSLELKLHLHLQFDLDL